MNDSQILATALALAGTVEWQKVGDLQVILQAIQSGQVREPLTGWLADRAWGDNLAFMRAAALFQAKQRFPVVLGLSSLNIPTHLMRHGGDQFCGCFREHGDTSPVAITVPSAVLSAYDMRQPSTHSRVYTLLRERVIPIEQVFRFVCAVHANPEFLKLDEGSINVFLSRLGEYDWFFLLYRRAEGWKLDAINATLPLGLIDRQFPGNLKTRLIFPSSAGGE